MSCITMFIYKGLYFCLYVTFKIYTKNSFIKSLIGWSSTIIAGAYAYPFDTVRRRMIIRKYNIYQNSFFCFKYFLFKEGWKSLYKGHSANFLRSLCDTSVLALFDKVKDLLNK